MRDPINLLSILDVVDLQGDDMTGVDIATALIALYAAFLSTWIYLKERKVDIRVSIKIKDEPEYYTPDENGHLIPEGHIIKYIISAKNFGKRTAIINSFCLKLRSCASLIE